MNIEQRSEGTPEALGGADASTSDLGELAHYGASVTQLPTEIEKLSLRQVKFLSEVKLAVEVVVGTFSASLEELIDLAPGSTFDFALDPREPVSLLLSGEKIAEAQFVAEDGGLYLEITSTPHSGTDT